MGKKSKVENKSSKENENVQSKGGGSVWKALPWILAFLFGTGWLTTWLAEWDPIDSEANKVIDVLKMADKISPDSEKIDGFFAFLRVPRKAAFIRKVQGRTHVGVKPSFFGSRTDIGFADKEAWKSAVISYSKIEERLHPREFKMVSLSRVWQELPKSVNRGNSNALQVAPGLSERVLAAATALPYFRPDSERRVSGVIVNKLPAAFMNSGYPVVELYDTKVMATISDKERSALRGKYFVPNVYELPSEAFDKPAEGGM